MAQVDLQAGPFRVVSLMSREAADELGLEPGVIAVATVKATERGRRDPRPPVTLRRRSIGRTATGSDRQTQRRAASGCSPVLGGIAAVFLALPLLALLQRTPWSRLWLAAHHRRPRPRSAPVACTGR